MPVLMLTLRSLWNRRVTAMLTIFSIALSVCLLLGVERVRKAAQDSFENTISGTDLLVGARSGPVQLLLYAVFRMGNATNNIGWDTYEHFAAHPDVAWTIPISLGDSHRGFRVVGTTEDYFRYYRYGGSHRLEFAAGHPMTGIFDAVLGAEVAETLGYGLETAVVLSHGIDETGFQNHEDKPFRIVGVLARTGTPVDRSVHISLEGIEAIHVDWQEGAPPRRGTGVSADSVAQMALQPEAITAFMMGLKSRIGIFQLQREINTYPKEPLLAVLPGATFQELWKTISVVESALFTVSAFVVLAGLLGMVTSLLTTLNERRREMAILRSVGAKPFHIFFLLLSEAGFLAGMGALTGVGLLFAVTGAGAGWVQRLTGLYLEFTPLSGMELLLLGGIFLSGIAVGAVPAWRAYHSSLSDGLTIRV